MTLRGEIRRWAAAGMLAALGISGAENALAQQGDLLPTIKANRTYSSADLHRQPMSRAAVRVPPRAPEPVMAPETTPVIVAPVVEQKVPVLQVADGLPLGGTSSAVTLPPLSEVGNSTPPVALPNLSVPAGQPNGMAGSEAVLLPPIVEGMTTVQGGMPQGMATPSSAPVGVSGGATVAPGCDACKGAGAGVPAAGPFAKNPPYTAFPRPGYFPMVPTGPGQYSLEDVLTNNQRPAPPKYPYPRFFSLTAFSSFDLNWRYLDDPKNTETDFWDCIKRQKFGPDNAFLFTAGGQFHARYTHEENSRAQVRGRNNTFDLYRLRLWADVAYEDKLRFFVEGISALSPDYLLTPAPIDRNYADLLNAFMDVNLGEVDNSPIWFRVGRQELLYGSQRSVSPLEWANTRRTFQGGKLFWHTEKNDIDAFIVQPVVINPSKFDSVDNNQIFAGLWYTHRPNKNQAMDLYYLMLDNTNATLVGENGRRGGTTVHTFGGRYVGDYQNFLWDFEGMLQAGEYAGQDLFAGAFTAGLGYHFKDTFGGPSVWAYFDHASGEGNPGQGGSRNTFNQLFPFGHYYLGYIDIIGRRNINDANVVVNWFPTNWVFTQLQFHAFFLDNRRDSLYNAAGNAIRTSANGSAGRNVGQEIDFLTNFHLSNHSDLLLGYSVLFADEFLKRTAVNAAGRRDVQLIYAQYSYRW